MALQQIGPNPLLNSLESVVQCSKMIDLEIVLSFAMLTEESIQSTVIHENLVVRNLQVTQGYHTLSHGMKRFMGSRNVSWCAFATHASKTAGQAIRHELMPRMLKSAMLRMAGYENTFFFLNDVLDKRNLEQEGGRLGNLAEAMKRVSLLVSAGNILVYQELAWPFASLIRTFYKQWDYDEAKLQQFLNNHLKPGPLESGGQDYLYQAFTAYYNARFTTKAKQKAEYILQGNLLIGLHEQTRLQSYIEKALAVPFDVFLDGDSKGDAGRAKGFGQRLMGGSGEISRELVTRAVTRMLMSITLPNRELKLGENVVAPSGVISFPADLLTIEDPQCQLLVRRFETGLDTLSGSAADNWVSLKDRMSFVVDFFRSHQQYKRLFEQPFRKTQVPAIEAGFLPGGPL